MKWVFVKRMKDIRSGSTIKILREYFSYWSIPAKLITDNIPSLCSNELKKFLESNEIVHINIAPYNPSSNGAAENLVRTVKNYLKKVMINSKDIDTDILKFILSYNNTKHCSKRLLIYIWNAHYLHLLIGSLNFLK